MEQFKIRASALSQIMGAIGLTDKQDSELMRYIERDSDPSQKPLTPLMREEMKALIQKRDNPVLPQSAISYLEEWYSGEEKKLHSKEIDKGIMCEHECIQFMSYVLDLGLIEKNRDHFTLSHMTGTPDVITSDAVYDVKCSWDKRTLQQKCNGMDHAYWWQGVQYLILTKRNKFVLFYGLMDTDESINYGTEVIYSDMPDSERWIAYSIEFTDEQLSHLEQQIIQRVEMCRDYLTKYDQQVRSKLGRIN